MAAKSFYVEIARRADNMLLVHIEFLARVSPSAARKLLGEFKKVSQELAEDPYRFPYADEIDVPGIPPKTYRKCLFYKRYKALFLIENNNVYVDAIVDSRQENKNLY